MDTPGVFRTLSGWDRRLVRVAGVGARWTSRAFCGGVFEGSGGGHWRSWVSLTRMWANTPCPHWKYPGLTDTSSEATLVVSGRSPDASSSSSRVPSACRGACSDAREKPVAELASDLGISDSCLRNWMAQADRDDGRRSDDLTTVDRATSSFGCAASCAWPSSRWRS